MPYNGWLPASIQPLVELAEEQRKAKRAERAAAADESPPHEMEVTASGSDEDVEEGNSELDISVESRGTLKKRRKPAMVRT